MNKNICTPKRGFCVARLKDKNCSFCNWHIIYILLAIHSNNIRIRLLPPLPKKGLTLISCTLIYCFLLIILTKTIPPSVFVFFLQHKFLFCNLRYRILNFVLVPTFFYHSWPHSHRPWICVLQLTLLTKFANFDIFCIYLNFLDYLTCINNHELKTADPRRLINCVLQPITAVAFTGTTLMLTPIQGIWRLGNSSIL